MMLKDFICFKKITIAQPVIEGAKIKAKYILEIEGGGIQENELIYSYEKSVFDPNSMQDQNLAAMILSQVVINYGLFAREIEFQGIYEDSDIRFIADMMENTSREIYVNKLLWDNPYLTKEYRNPVLEKKKKFTQANLVFKNNKANRLWEHWNLSGKKICILSSGGKDSLLSYGVTRESGYQVYPYFINESGRHWFTAINAYRYLKETDKNTGRVWTNSDRIFNWILKNMDTPDNQILL
jgi:hypothetical protein